MSKPIYEVTEGAMFVEGEPEPARIALGSQKYGKLEFDVTPENAVQIGIVDYEDRVHPPEYRKNQVGVDFFIAAVEDTIATQLNGRDGVLAKAGLPRFEDLDEDIKREQMNAMVQSYIDFKNIDMTPPDPRDKSEKADRIRKRQAWKAKKIEKWSKQADLMHQEREKAKK